MTWFATHGVRVRQLLTDNAMVYRRGTDWAQVCSDWQPTRRFTKPGCPWTNGKAERFNPNPAHRMGLRPTLDEQQPAHTRP